jgi:hypothetical protein
VAKHRLLFAWQELRRSSESFFKQPIYYGKKRCVSGKKREARCHAFEHFRNMKNKFIGEKLSGLTRPKIIVAITLACGFWISQFLMWNFVGTVLGTLPEITGVLSFGAFVLFSIVRMSHPWFRLPTSLGLCSSGVLISLFSYLSYFQARSVEFTGLLVLLSLGLAFVGLALDMERFWHLINKTHDRMRSSFAAVGRSEHAIYF